MAVVAEDARQIAYREIEVPAPGPDEVVVRVVVSWISNGTEGSFVRGERIQGDIPWRETDPWPFPHVPGYQKCGFVKSVGENVTHVKEGDRVFSSISWVRGGMFWDYGGHVSPAITPAGEVRKLPDNVSFTAASGLVLAQVGYNSGIRPPVEQGDFAVVIGDGLVGHWSAQTLAHRGARIALVGRHDSRLGKYALKDGDILINEKNESAIERIAEWSGNQVQIVVDTVGSVPAIVELYPTMRFNGHVVSAGFYGEKADLDIQKLRAKELTLHTPAGWSAGRMDATLDWLSKGYIQTEHLITHRFRVTEAAKAYELILARNEPVLGVVLDWE